MGLIENDRLLLSFLWGKIAQFNNVIRLIKMLNEFRY
jgi:hypothetical protein